MIGVRKNPLHAGYRLESNSNGDKKNKLHHSAIFARPRGLSHSGQAGFVDVGQGGSRARLARNPLLRFLRRNLQSSILGNSNPSMVNPDFRETILKPDTCLNFRANQPAPANYPVFSEKDIPMTLSQPGPDRQPPYQ
jgi:hypothetical protein